MLAAILSALGVIGIVVGIYVLGLKRALRGALNKPSGEPTPEQARIKTESLERLEKIDAETAKTKEDVQHVEGEDLRKLFVSRLFKRK